MQFFNDSVDRGRSHVDRIILYAGYITDNVILDLWTRSRAESIARQRKEIEDLEQRYPGYRTELNRQRAFVGLPPL